MGPLTAAAKRLTDATLAYLVVVNGYLLTLLLAANLPPRRPSHSDNSLELLVIVPAHNEEKVIVPTLESLMAQDYPRERCELVVIADNCSDRTGEVAASFGATVHRRTAPDQMGKGYALSSALNVLLEERPHVEAVVIVDADCAASSNLLSSLASRLSQGAPAAQGDYVVANPGDSAAAGLRYAAFSAMATVRPRGKARLGLSSGLFGSGMAISRATLDAEPWTAASLVEDFEYHLRLVDRGMCVEFVPEARVTSPMPTSLAASESQQMRWESGKWSLVRSWTPRLVASGLRHRDAVRVHAGLEQLVLPQTLLMLTSVVNVVANATARRRRHAWVAGWSALAQAVFVVGSLRTVDAPAAAYMSLAAAPSLVVQKLVLYARLLGGRGPATWVRTARSEHDDEPV